MTDYQSDPFERAAAREVELQEEGSTGIERRATQQRNYALASLQGLIVLAILLPLHWLAVEERTPLLTVHIVLLAAVAIASLNWWLQRQRTISDTDEPRL